MSNQLQFQNPRSREMLVQMLMQGGGVKPTQGGSWAEGLANATQPIFQAIMAKQLMGEDAAQQESKNAAMSRYMEAPKSPGFSTMNIPKDEQGNVAMDYGAPQTYTQQQAPGSILNAENKNALLAKILDPQQALMLQMEQEQRANQSTKLGPHEGMFNSQGKMTAVNRVPTGRPDVSPISRLIAERDALPPGDPRRVILDKAISKDTAAPDAGPKETWSNPVSEIHPETGKPILVRYSNLKNREIVPDAVPARQGNAFDRPDYWRAQFKPYTDAALNTSQQSRKVKASLSLGNGVGDIAAINALQKQIDEGAVVREQDVALIQSAQSLVGRLVTAEGKLKEGDVLTPDMRLELQGVSDALTNAIQEGVQARIEPYREVMSGEGTEFENVIPKDVQALYGWKSRAPAQFSQGAIPGIPNGARVASTAPSIDDLVNRYKTR